MSRQCERIVPIVGALRELLLELKVDAVSGYVFGAGERPFSPSIIYLRARRACQKAGLEGIGLHAYLERANTLGRLAALDPR